MLHFFRKHQKIFFFFTAIIIILTFSFFGTYKTLSGSSRSSLTAFVAVDGTKVSNAELASLIQCISTDGKDRLIYGSQRNANMLNDGVMENDFFVTGLAEIIALRYIDEIRSELSTRFPREKNFTPYEHPDIALLNSESIWNRFAPGVKRHLQILQNSEDPTEKDSFHNRVQLYLAERSFPPTFLRQMLRYQENQYNWLPADPALPRADLSLFGYHSIKDWFGNSFMELVGQCIINASIIAEQKGYYVSREEILTDLITNCEKNIALTKARESKEEIFNTQLRMLGMNLDTMMTSWKHIMLFRRLFHHTGNTVLTAPLSFQQFQQYATETTAVDTYHLPSHLHLKTLLNLQSLESYLGAVTPHYTAHRAKTLSLPEEFFPPSTVKERHPQLVQRRYLVDIAHVTTQSLQVRVGMQELLQWKLDENNWKTLAQQFPFLPDATESTKAERFDILDALDDKTSDTVDRYVRWTIVDNNPDWILSALDNSPSEKKVLAFRYDDPDTPLNGVHDSTALIALLNSNDEEQLKMFSEDETNYYRITVLDSSADEILTFAEAKESTGLSTLIHSTLEPVYEKIRLSNAQSFRDESGEWKPLTDVIDSVAKHHLSRLLNNSEKEFHDITGNSMPDQLASHDSGAQLRLYRHVTSMQEKLRSGDHSVTILELDSLGEKTLPMRSALQDQWKLKKVSYSLQRKEENPPISIDDVFSLSPSKWSSPLTNTTGDISFFQVIDRFIPDISVIEKVTVGHQLLSYDAQRCLMDTILTTIDDNRGISLSKSTGIP